MTLGGGSAMASLYLGAHYQYNLLWVQPLAIDGGYHHVDGRFPPDAFHRDASV